jgi:molybdopterin-guanine dinucleotide biosynthesis protein
MRLAVNSGMSSPFIIGIGGSHSGVGKTTVAEVLLRRFLVSGLRSLRTLRRWGAIKYTKTDLYSSIIEDRAVLEVGDKDTGRLLNAGAEEVLWIQSPREELKELVSVAIGRLSYLDGIIIEGNSAIEFSAPDVVILKLGAIGQQIKSSALRLIEQADIIVFPKSSMQDMNSGMNSGDTLLNFCELSKVSPEFIRRKFMRIVYHDPEDEMSKEELLACMDEVAEELMADKIKQALNRKAVEGRISCSDARQIAGELRTPFADVGKAANELKIKITECELGCF